MDYRRATQIADPSAGMMSQQEVEAYRLAQYLKQVGPQPQAQPPTPGGAAQIGNAAGQLGGMYAGNQLLGSSTSAIPATPTGLSGSFVSTTPAVTEAAPTLMGNAAGLGALPLAAIAAQTMLSGKAGYDMLQGKRPEGVTGTIGRVGLGIATGGISEIANAFLNRPTTRDVAKRHTKDLLKTGQDNPAWQAYVQGMRAQYNEAPKGKAFGQYDTWNEAKAAGLDAGNLTGVYGNLKTFGPDWAGYGLDRQKQIVQALIDADLYKSKKGEVIVTDAVKAQALRDQILKTALPKPSVAVATTTPAINPSTAPILTFTEGVNGTKIPVFAPSPATLAKYDEINKAKGIVKK